MRGVALFALLAALAGCGVDGAPERPEVRESGVVFSGTASVGISGGTGQ